MRIEEQAPLARHTTFGVGGPARGLARPRTVEELQEALRWARDRDLPVQPIGLGSNLLVADEGVEALALRLEGRLAEVEVERERVRTGGGATNAVCLRRAREAELGGFEWACAIPGTVGGGVFMNAGAYGGDYAQVLVRALIVDADQALWLTPEQLGLRYRASGLRPGQIVAGAELLLVRRAEAEVKATIAELQARRKESQPTNRRTFGSVFKNPAHELSAGRMLDACGLRGHTVGGARISPMHANFIENAGGATCADALALMAEARRRAHGRFGVVLEPEVRLVGSIALPPIAAGAGE
ncbi:MAG: UDP-N-acetylmuramate dehydrogenase [Gaiellaceae bacterium]